MKTKLSYSVVKSLYSNLTCYETECPKDTIRGFLTNTEHIADLIEDMEFDINLMKDDSDQTLSDTYKLAIAELTKYTNTHK